MAAQIDMAPITNQIPDLEVERVSRFGDLFPVNKQPVRLMLWFQDRSGKNELLPVEFFDEITLGWVHQESSCRPDVDLAPYGGQEMGVSRCHLRITRSDVLLRVEDLGSTNGTQINGRTMFPGQPLLLRDGDQLHLGHLTLRVVFFEGSTEL